MLELVRFAYRRTFRKDPSRIVNVLIKLSSKCNLMCSHCYETPNENLKGEIEFGEYERFARQVKDLWILSITGGEPFLKPDLVRIVNLFDARNVFLTTNGYSPERIGPEVEVLLRSRPKRTLVVAVSIDGSKEMHNLIRNNKLSYDRAVQTVRMLQEMQARFGTLRVKVNTVLVAANVDAVGDIMDEVYETMRPDFHSILLFMDEKVISGDPVDQEKLAVVNPVAVGHAPVEKLEAARQIIFEKWNRYSYGENPIAAWILKRYNRGVLNESIRSIRNGWRTFGCYAGRSVWRLDPHGDVRPCHWLEPFGKVQTDSVEEMLRGNRYRKVIQSIKVGRCSCIEHSIFLDNFLLDPVQLVRMLWVN